MPDLSVSILLEGRNLASGAISQVKGELDGLSGSADRAGGGLSSIGGMAAAGFALGAGIAAFQALGSALEGVVTGAAAFQTTMTNLANNTGLVGQQVTTAGDAVLAMSSKYGVATDAITEGYKHVMNITQDAAASQVILNNALESAASTGANVGAVANVLAGTLHEYGLDTSNAGTETQRLADINANATHVMGIMHVASQISNVDLGQWTAALSTSIGIASGMHVPLEDIGAMFASLSKHGFPDAAQAGTQIQDLFAHLLHLTPQATAALADLGKKSGEDLPADLKLLNAGSMGMVEFMDKFRGALESAGFSTAQMREEVFKIIPAMRGGFGAAALLTTGFEDMNTGLVKLHDETAVNTVTQAGWAATLATASKQWDILTISVANAGTELGTRFLPTVTPIITAMNAALPGALKAAGDAFNAAVVATQQFRDALMIEFSELDSAVQLLFNGHFPEALDQASRAIFTFGAYIVDHVARWAVAFEMWVLDAIPGMMQNLGSLLGMLGDWISGNGTSTINGKLPAWVTAFVDWVKDVWGPLATRLTEMAGQLGQWITGYALPFIGGKLLEWGTAFVNWIGPASGPMMAALGDLVGQAVEWLGGTALPAIVSQVDTWGAAFVEWVAPRIGPMLGELASLLGTVVNWAVSTALPAIAGSLLTWGVAFVEWILPLPARVVGELASLNGSMIRWIGDQVPSIAFSLGAWTGAFLTWIGNAVLAFPDELGKLLRSIQDWVNGEGMTGSVKAGNDLASSIVDGFTKFFTTAIPTMVASIGNLVPAAIQAMTSAMSSFGAGYQSTTGSAPSTNTGASSAGFESGGAGGTGNIPAPGDKAGWAIWLKNSGAIPSDLVNDPAFLDVLLTGAQAESRLNANVTQPFYTDAQGRRAGGAAGLFQFDPGGMGAGLSPDFLNSPAGTLYEAQQIIPKYAAAYRRTGGGNAAAAALVADSAEAPYGNFPGGQGDTNYRNAYGAVAGTGAGLHDIVPSGQAAAGPAGTYQFAPGGANYVATDAGAAGVDPTVSISKTMDPITKRFAALVESTQADYAKIQVREDKSYADALTKLGPGGTAVQAANTAAADQTADLTRSHDLAASNKQATDALNERLKQEAQANSERVAAEELVYNRTLQDQATIHARTIQDQQIVATQKLQDQATIHTRTLQDAEILYQSNVSKQATLHQQELQNEQIKNTQQLANAALLHQRQLQDAAIPVADTLSDAATGHSRELQNAEIVYQQGIANAKAAHDYQEQLNTATSDAQRAQIQATYAKTKETMADATAAAAVELAHQRQLQDAEERYQEGLAAKALQAQRALQDTEIAYQQGIAATQLAKTRADAQTESEYQMGLKATELAHQRQLQDTETAYQRGVAATALAQQRADADKETAYQRGIEDTAIVHKNALAKAAADFAAGQQAQVAALAAQQAEAAYQLQLAKIEGDRVAKIASIATQYEADKKRIADTAAAERLALKISSDDKAATIIQEAIDAGAKAKIAASALDPIIAQMRADWEGLATSAVTANTTAVDSVATAATDIAASAQDISNSFGITDTAVETYARIQKKTWDDARSELNTMVAAYGVGSSQVSAAFGVTDRAVEAFATIHKTTWDDARSQLNDAAIKAGQVLGDGGSIPVATSKSTTAITSLGIEVAHIPTPLQQMQDAATRLASQGLDPAAIAAKNLQNAIASIQNREISVVTNYTSNGQAGGLTAGGNQGLDMTRSGGGGSSSSSSSSSDSHASPFGASTIGSSGPGGKYNDPSTGQPYTHAAGGVTTGPVGGVFGEAGPEAIIPLADYTFAHKSEGGSGRLTREDARMIAEELAIVMQNVNLSVGVDTVHSALLKKAKANGRLGLG